MVSVVIRAIKIYIRTIICTGKQNNWTKWSSVNNQNSKTIWSTMEHMRINYRCNTQEEKAGNKCSIIITNMFLIEDQNSLGVIMCNQGCQPYPILGYNTPFRHFVPQTILYPWCTYFVPHLYFWGFLSWTSLCVK